VQRFSLYSLCSGLHPLFFVQCSSPSCSLCSVLHPFTVFSSFAHILSLATVRNCSQSMLFALWCMTGLIPLYPECCTHAFPRVAGRAFNYKCFAYPRNNLRCVFVFSLVAFPIHRLTVLYGSL
jgi:hypothetical protein